MHAVTKLKRGVAEGVGFEPTTVFKTAKPDEHTVFPSFRFHCRRSLSMVQIANNHTKSARLVGWGLTLRDRRIAGHSISPREIFQNFRVAFPCRPPSLLSSQARTAGGLPLIADNICEQHFSAATLLDTSSEMFSPVGEVR